MPWAQPKDVSIKIQNMDTLFRYVHSMDTLFRYVHDVDMFLLYIKEMLTLKNDK